MSKIVLILLRWLLKPKHVAVTDYTIHIPSGDEHGDYYLTFFVNKSTDEPIIDTVFIQYAPKEQPPVISDTLLQGKYWEHGLQGHQFSIIGPVSLENANRLLKNLNRVEIIDA